VAEEALVAGITGGHAASLSQITTVRNPKHLIGLMAADRTAPQRGRRNVGFLGIAAVTPSHISRECL